MTINTRNIPTNLTPEFHPKACPHCGKPGIMRRGGTYHITGCSDPNCIGSQASINGSKVLSLRAWNKRSEPRPGWDYWNTPVPAPAPKPVSAWAPDPQPAPARCGCNYCNPPTTPTTPPVKRCACCGQVVA